MLICSLLVFSAACAPANDPSTGGGEGDAYTYTSEYIIRDGKSDYSIVYPENARGYEYFAAQELRDFILESSNVELPLYADNEVTYSNNAKLLVVGESKFAEEQDALADYFVVGTRGFIIKGVGSNVFMNGGETTGTLFSVYEFLHHQFGYEPYYIDAYKLDKGVFERKLISFNMEEIPDIPYACGTGTFLETKNQIEALRLRFNHYNDIYIDTRGGNPWHNTFYLIPPEDYRETHPKWFTQGESQLHYTCYGDETELALLQQEVFKKLVECIEDDFAAGNFYEMIGFMQQDNNGQWAKSDEPYFRNDDGTLYEGHTGEQDSVALLNAKYGSATPAAMLIQFINPVARMLKDYMDENWGGRKMLITFFAYHDTEMAPTKVVAGEDVPIDSSVVLEDNVCVQIAPEHSNFTQDYEETGLDLIIKRWTAITKNIALWFYDYYTSPNYFYYDSLYTFQRRFQLCNDLGAFYIFNESTMALSPFYIIRLYIQSKLMWNVDADLDALIDDFFTNYYLDASQTMREYFELIRTQMALNLSRDEGLGSINNTSIDNRNLWPTGMLHQCNELLNQSFKAIEHYKEEDVALYENLKKRILFESFSIRWMLLTYDGLSFTQDEFDAEAENFIRDLKSVGITVISKKPVDQIGFTRG